MKKVCFQFMRITLVLLLLFLMLFVSQALSQQPPSKLVSTEWLNQNLSQEKLRIIDVRENIKDYWQGHIPQAVYFNSEALRLADHGVPGKLMPPEALVVMLGKMGVDEKTTIVVYAEQNDFKPTYFIWALDYLGHPSAAMLEGGFDRWKTENRQLTQNYPKIKEVKYDLPSKLNREIRATLEELKEVANRSDAVLLDVRPSELYDGEKGFWKIKGHIPGAINHFFGDDLNEDGSWKSEEKLKAAYQELGATPEKTIITSCGQGLMSSHTYFTLRYVLGYPRVKNYDGGFNEWSNMDELPVEAELRLNPR